MKQFLEFMSKQEKEVGQKVAKMEKAEVIAFAAENGFTLTEADFEPQEEEGEDFGDGGCACVAYGQGDSIWEGEHDSARCTCVLGGYGHSDA